MGAATILLRYRPLRIGWCVAAGDMDGLTRAIRLSHCFWGGPSWPVIAVGGGYRSSELPGRFRLDCLYPISSGAEIRFFAESFHELRWPAFTPDLFDTRGRPFPTDIYGPLRRLESDRGALAHRPPHPLIHEWEDDDPLRHIFLSTLGGYPVPSPVPDYLRMVSERLNAAVLPIRKPAPLPSNALNAEQWFLPRDIALYGLSWDRSPGMHDPGVYSGVADSFDDLIAYWNLRAAGINLVFFDPAHAERLAPLCKAYIGDACRSRRPRLTPSEPAMWSRDRGVADSGAKALGILPMIHEVSDDMWYGYGITPPVEECSGTSALAQVSRDQTGPSLSFQLPPKPFPVDDDQRNERIILSIERMVAIADEEQHTLFTPYIPALNEAYSRSLIFTPNDARVQYEGVGLVTRLDQTNLTVHALDKTKLLREIFQGCGIAAAASKPGQIATRAIRQMGGLQGCRVFKIAGVRKLIREFGADQSFTRSAALQLIGDVRDDQLHFEKYKTLHIEPREELELKPSNAFDFLLDRRVFRVGLDLLCPSCDLEFWLAIDDVRNTVECSMCETRFTVGRQMKDRDWRYRRSGLFGGENNQEGAIPVALTLQQLDANLAGLNQSLFHTGLNLKPAGASIHTCEIDFAWLEQQSDGRLDLAIGECKSQGPAGGSAIKSDDVEKLKAVAEALRPIARVSIVFSKTASFTPEEVALCKGLSGTEGLGVILLSDTELEPYFVYSDRVKAGEVALSVIALDDLVKGTRRFYFAS